MIYGYHARDGKIVRSDGWSCTEKAISSLYELSQEGDIHIAAHLDQFAAQAFVISGLNFDELNKINNLTEITIQPYIIKYIPGKFLSVGSQESNKFFLIADANQYDYWSFNKDAAGIEILAGALHAKFAGEDALQALKELGLNPTNLISPIRAWEKERWLYLDCPTVTEMPGKAALFSYRCCKGNWLELFFKGHFPKAYDYDIRSAYASVAAECLDTRYGQWIENKNYQPEAVYAYLKGTVTIRSKFSPILYKYKKDTYSPMGVWETYITKSEYDYIYKYKIGEFEIEDAVWWRPDQEVKPLYLPIAQLYEQKENSTGLTREVVKRIINGGFYGKFIQITYSKDFGDHFFSPWAAEIETRTRLRVAETCLANKIVPISIAVDGMVTDRKIPVFPGKKLGNWKLSSECSALAVSSGVVALSSHIPDKDFSLDYEWLMQQIKENPDIGEYPRTKWSPVTLAKAMNELRPQDLGKVQKITQTIDVGYEQKRYVDDAPKTGQELLDKIYTTFPKDTAAIMLGDLVEEDQEPDSSED